MKKKCASCSVYKELVAALKVIAEKLATIKELKDLVLGISKETEQFEWHAKDSYFHPDAPWNKRSRKWKSRLPKE